jgi:hypothetical protein
MPPKKATPKAAARRGAGKTRAVQQPAAKSVVVKRAAPVFRSLPDGGIVVRFKEYVGSFGEYAAWDTDRLRINPGDPKTFPWLSSVASAYDRYTFSRVRLDMEPRVGTDTSGQVVVCFDVDAEDPAPTSFVNACTYPHVRGPIWGRFSFEVPRDALHQRKSNFVSASVEGRQQDCGMVYIGAENNPSASGLGVSIEYEVHLMSPQQRTNLTRAVIPSGPGAKQLAGTNKNAYPTAGLVKAQGGPGIYESVKDIIKLVDYAWEGGVSTTANPAPHIGLMQFLQAGDYLVNVDVRVNDDMVAPATVNDTGNLTVKAEGAAATFGGAQVGLYSLADWLAGGASVGALNNNWTHITGVATGAMTFVASVAKAGLAIETFLDDFVQAASPELFWTDPASAITISRAPLRSRKLV